MKVIDKFVDGVNKFINVTDKEPVDTVEETAAPVAEEPEFEAPVREARPRTAKNIVSIGSRTAPAAAPVATYAESQMMVRKVNSLQQAGEIVNLVKSGHIVVVNLEECTDRVLNQRIIDLLCGAAFALESGFKNVADDTYVLTPKGIRIDLPSAETSEE